MKTKGHQEIVIVTVIGQEGIPDSLLGQKMGFTSEGRTGNSSLPWLEEQAEELVQRSLASGMFQVAGLLNPAMPEQKVTVMIDPILPPHELVILGGGHIALPLVSIGRLLDYRVVVVDDRPEFVSPERFPEADEAICCNFDDIGKVLHLGARSSVVIVTRGHKHDLNCLRQVIKYPLAYAGMIGSRRKVHMIREQLIHEGVGIEKVDSVHMPIGVDIGAETPAEIAVSIAAELIKVRRGGTAPSLKGGPAHAATRANTGEIPSARDMQVLQKAIDLALSDIPSALVTIVKTRGSSPRKEGAKMLVFSDGRTWGTVGGGFAETEARKTALEVIEKRMPRVFQVLMDADTVEKEGMVCGGMVEFFIEPVNAFIRVFSEGEKP